MHFINTKSFLDCAKSGNMACPSCTIELVTSTESGTIPFANIITNKRCGPDSGIKPTSPAITRTIHREL